MCYWCFNAKNLNIEFLFSASRRRPRGLAISIIKGIIPERLIHPFVNECLLDVGALPGTTLAAHQGTTWAHFLTSLPKAPKYPRTKEEQGETRSSHISAAMRSPQRTRWPRPLRTVRWSEGRCSHLPPPGVPEPSSVLGILLAFVLPFPEPKRQRSGTNMKLLFVWEWITLVKGGKILPI